MLNFVCIVEQIREKTSSDSFDGIITNLWHMPMKLIAFVRMMSKGSCFCECHNCFCLVRQENVMTG